VYSKTFRARAQAAGIELPPLPREAEILQELIEPVSKKYRPLSNEQYSSLFPEHWQQAAKLHENLTSVCTIVDAKGLDPANLSIAKCIQWAKGMAEVDYLHYPGRLGHMFIINSPSIVQKIWSLIQFTLSEKQRKSIHIYSDRSQWEPVLMSYIDADQLPPEYGGCAPNRALEGIPLAR